MKTERSASPMVSVVVPVYNAGHQIEEALSRLLNQSYDNLEIILVDDASDDETLSVLRAFARGQPKCRLVELPANLGPGGARNAGLSVSVGEYVWFVDWDDEWSAQYLTVMVSLMEQNDAKVALCGARWKSESGKVLHRTEGFRGSDVISGLEAFTAVLTGDIRGYLWSKLFKRDSLEADLFPEMRTQEDLVAVARTLRRVDTVVITSDVLVWHIKRLGSVTNSVHPPLENLRRAGREVMLIAEDCRSSRKNVAHFELAFVQLALVGTALRLSDRVMAEEVVRAVQMEITARMLFLAALVSPTTAAKGFLVRASGSHYRRIRTMGLTVRNQLRKWV